HIKQDQEKKFFSDMDSVSFKSAIEDLSLQLLLSSPSDAATLTAALARLATIVQQANEVGEASVASGAGRLLETVNAELKSAKPPQDVIPVLLNGLKNLDSGDASSGVSEAKATPAAAAPESDSIAQDPELLQDF